MRATWDDTWMRVADAVALRSGCCRRQIGAVVVDANNRIVATGYNGPPAGLKSNEYIGGEPFKYEREATCEEDCPRNRAHRMDAQGFTNPETELLSYDNCISIHAEANALLFCDRRDREGGTIYVSSSVCYDCAKQIANSGLTRIVMRLEDRDAYRKPERGIEFLKKSGLEVHVRKDEHRGI